MWAFLCLQLEDSQRNWSLEDKSQNNSIPISCNCKISLLTEGNNTQVLDIAAACHWWVNFLFTDFRMFTKLFDSFWVKMHLNHCVFWLLHEKTKHVQILWNWKWELSIPLHSMGSSVLLNIVQLSASDFIYGYQPGLLREHGLTGELIQSVFFYWALNWNLKCTSTGSSGGFKRNLPATNTKESTRF